MLFYPHPSDCSAAWVLGVCRRKGRLVDFLGNGKNVLEGMLAYEVTLGF